MEVQSRLNALRKTESTLLEMSQRHSRQNGKDLAVVHGRSRAVRLPPRLPADHLLSLIYYNVFRAFAANMTILGLDFDTMCCDETLSPFLDVAHDEPHLTLLPPGLRPTHLQCKAAHHPCWDIFPDPVVRDNVFLRGEDQIDDIDLCEQIVGDGSVIADDDDTENRTGLIVWGEPADINSWEASESFVKLWPWFFKGAVELMLSTNRWRATRDQPPIVFEM